MIEYDYIIKRDEHDEEKTYLPGEIGKQLPNLVCIEEPNSSGKSTLLHILALSFHGLRNENIKPSLREKIDNLVNSEHQKIGFNLNITNKDGSIEFSSTKDIKQNDIELRDASKQIVTVENFKRKYNLIYDIPEDPIKRLNELTNEIKTIQLSTHKKIGSLRSHLADIISNIRRSRDPEQIEKEKTDKKNFEGESKKKDRIIKDWEEDLNNTRLYAGLRFFTEYKEQEKMLVGLLKDRQKEGQKKLKEKKKATEEYNNLYKELQDKIEIIETSQLKVTPILKNFLGNNEKNRLLLWNDANIRKEIADHEINQVLKYESSYFRDVLQELHKKESQSANVKEAHDFKELISVLENYKNIHIKIPGYDILIGNLVESLRKEANKYDDLIAKTETLSRAIHHLDQILINRKYIVESLLPRLKTAIDKGDESSPKEDTTHDNETNKLEINLKDCREKIEYYKVECAKSDIGEKDIPEYYQSFVLGRVFKNLNDYDEEGIKQKKYNLEEHITTERRALSKIKSNIEFLEREIESLEKKEEHPYQEHLKYLENVLSKIQGIEQKFNTYEGYIDQLIKNKVDKYKIKSALDKKEMLQYFEHVFRYLGKRLDTIRHIDGEYKVDKIDLIDNEIFTTEGKVINISDMGTGQAQSAYLKGLLSLNDGRKIIALIDEVAMMDQESLSPIYNLLKELYNANKLLLGVIVQKSEKMRVIPIE